MKLGGMLIAKFFTSNITTFQNGIDNKEYPNQQVVIKLTSCGLGFSVV